MKPYEFLVEWDARQRAIPDDTLTLEEKRVLDNYLKEFNPEVLQSLPGYYSSEGLDRITITGEIND